MWSRTALKASTYKPLYCSYFMPWRSKGQRLMAMGHQPSPTPRLRAPLQGLLPTITDMVGCQLQNLGSYSPRVGLLGGGGLTPSHNVPNV